MKSLWLAVSLLLLLQNPGSPLAQSLPDLPANSGALTILP